MRRLLLSMLLCLSAAVLPACAMNGDRELPPPREGYVQDVGAFHEFIGEYQPTPEQLKAVYPDLHIVLPGEIATRELRLNNSRFFAKLDEEGRVVDGRFQ